MKFQRAFTLIEMLIALSLFCMLMFLSFSMGGDFLDHYQDEMMGLKILHTIQFARQESRARRFPVGICRSNDTQTCTQSHAENLLVFLARNTSDVLAKNALIKVISIQHANHILHWRTYPYYRDYLSFSPFGFSQNDNGTLWYCHKEESLPRWAITINKAGQTRMIQPNSQGEMRDTAGHDLSCNVTS